MESVSCSLLKLLCLTPDLEPRSTKHYTPVVEDRISFSNESGGNGARTGALQTQTLANGQTNTVAGADYLAKTTGTIGTTRSISSNKAHSFTGSTSSRKPLVYLDQVMRMWTSDPANQSTDQLAPGSSLETLNQIFEIRE